MGSIASILAKRTAALAAKKTGSFAQKFPRRAMGTGTTPTQQNEVAGTVFRGITVFGAGLGGLYCAAEEVSNRYRDRDESEADAFLTNIAHSVVGGVKGAIIGALWPITIPLVILPAIADNIRKAAETAAREEQSAERAARRMAEAENQEKQLQELNSRWGQAYEQKRDSSEGKGRLA